MPDRHLAITTSQVYAHAASGSVQGQDVIEVRRTLGDLAGIFADEASRESLPQESLAYRVEAHMAVPEGTEGGLFFGTSYLMPGKVGNEYMMTKGHFHAKKDTAEYYWCIAGEGMLILMDEERHTWGQVVRPGSLHYIPGRIAHRLANTGEQTLVVGACWPSDAGHDYGSIADHGFSARLLEVDGKPQFVEARS